MCEVVSFIKAYMMENESMKSVLVPKTVLKNVNWEPPNEDMIKIKFDASFHQEPNISRAGIIARNKEGLVMASCIPGRVCMLSNLGKIWAFEISLWKETP